MLARTLRVCRDNARPLATTAALITVPVTFIQLVVALTVDRWLADGEGWLGWAHHAGAGMVFVFDLLAIILTAGAITAMAFDVEAGRPVDFRAAWVRGLDKARPVVTANLAAMLVMLGLMALLAFPFFLLLGLLSDGEEMPVGLGMIPVFVAGLIVGIRYPFLAALALSEGTGGFAALRRQRVLARGHLRTVAGVILPLWSLTFVPAVLLPDDSVWRVLDGLWTALTCVPASVAAAVLFLSLPGARGAEEPPATGLAGG